MLLERLVVEKGHASFGVGDTRAMESRKADPDVSQAKSESREKYRPTRLFIASWLKKKMMRALARSIKI